MMERKQVTCQDRARECVAFPQRLSPIYLTKITGYRNSLKISTPQEKEKVKKPAKTLVDNELLIKVRAFRSEPRK